MSPEINHRNYLNFFEKFTYIITVGFNDETLTDFITLMSS